MNNIEDASQDFLSPASEDIEKINDDLEMTSEFEEETKDDLEMTSESEEEAVNVNLQADVEEKISDEDATSLSQWYILHTYSGFEQRVEQTIREMMRLKQDEGLIKEVVVPTERVIELGKGGKKRTTTRKFYPGYVMIRMTMTDYSWHLVQNIPKVTGFIGGKNRPAPMRPSEAASILALMEERQDQPRPKFHFEKNEEIRVIDGPFAGFNAMVEDVNYDKGKLKVSVSIFGRQTPVELDFIQVSKD